MAYSKDKLFTLPLCEGEQRFSADLKGLIAWLETQDGVTEYNQVDNFDCVLCRFISVVEGRPVTWSRVVERIPSYADRQVAHDNDPLRGPSPMKTYASVLSRARRALRESER